MALPLPAMCLSPEGRKVKSFIVVGGGPAGSSLAIRLAQAGLSVSLIEREAGPHDKVCGEFLSFEAVGYLKGVGLDPTALGGRRHRGCRDMSWDSVCDSCPTFSCRQLRPPCNGRGATEPREGSWR